MVELWYYVEKFYNDLANKNNRFLYYQSEDYNNFTEAANDYGTSLKFGAVMDTIASDISNYRSGNVYSITNGAVYTVIMNKGSDKYYSAIVFTYSLSGIYLFFYLNGSYSCKIIS